MSLISRLSQPVPVARIALAVVTAGLLAGCSSEFDRLAEGPFGSSDRTPVGTVLVPPSAIAPAAGSQNAPVIPPGRPAPITGVQSSPLPPPVSSRARNNLAVPAAPSPRIKNSRIKSPKIKTPKPRIAARGRSISTITARNLRRHGNWSPKGGTPVTVAAGETASTIERRYGVPRATLAKVNGLKSSRDIVPGATIVIPVYTSARKAKISQRSAAVVKSRNKSRFTKQTKSTAKKTRVRRAATATSNRSSRVKSTSARNSSSLRRTTRAKHKSGAARSPKSRATIKKTARETRSEKRARLSRERAAKRLAKRKKIAEQHRAKKEQALARAKAKQDRKDRLAAQRRKAETRKAATRNSVSKKPTRSAALDRNPVSSTASRSKATSRKFRWPARGRIIQGFRKGQNDGINIAVPEGTSVKATEGGVVAYAGSELKGYGNLVLIRHSNGYVSAYAHNKQLKVKRGDKISRGQTIAKAGRTGNVSTPQIHFEIRKGSTPLNPLPHLSR